MDFKHHQNGKIRQPDILVFVCFFTKRGYNAPSGPNYNRLIQACI